MADFTILSRDDYKKCSFPIKCKATEFALICGCKCTDTDLTFRDTYHAKYWTNEVYDQKFMVAIDSKDGLYDNVFYDNGTIGIRPAIYVSSIPNEFIKHIRKINNKVDLVEFGFMPQMACNLREQHDLHITRFHLDFSKNKFKYFYEISDCHHPYPAEVNRYISEYIMGNKKYMSHYPPSNFYNSFNFKKRNNETVICPYSEIWFEVEPIRWYLNKEKNLMVSEKILYAGYPYYTKNALDEAVIEFLNNEFYKYISFPYFEKIKEESKYIKPYSYKDKLFLDVDFSKVENIGYRAFFHSVGGSDVTLPATFDSISTDAFMDSVKFNLIIKTSLFSISSIFDESIEANAKFKKIFDVNSLTIFDTKDNIDIKIFKEIRKRELSKIIIYILSKYNLEGNNIFFDKLINSTQNLNIGRREFKENTIKTIYNYLCFKKIYLNKNRVLEEISNYFEDFYKEYYKKIELKEIENKPFLKENNLNKYEIEKVYELLINEKVLELINNDFVTIMDYGNNFDNYFDYIANQFSAILSKDSEQSIKVDNLKGLFENYRLVSEGNINEDSFNYLSVYLDGSIKELEEKIRKMEETKKLSVLYMSKLKEMVNYLNTIDNSIIKSKIDSLNYLNLNILRQINQMDIIMENNFNLLMQLNNVSKTLLPNLLLALNDKNNEADNLFKQIFDLLNIDNSKVKKLKKK